MKTTFKYILLSIIAYILVGCIPDDIPVQPYEPGDVETQTFEMTKSYSNQIFFELSSNTIVKTNVYDIWDLGFQVTGDGLHIILNYAKFMKAIDLGPVNFDEITNYERNLMKFDAASGNLDSTIIGKWWTETDNKIISKGHTYIIDRGFDTRNRKLNVLKMQILGFDDNTYRIKFSNLNGSNLFEYEIPINEAYNFIKFNFDDGGKIIDVEPEKTRWDLLFTKFCTLIPYQDGLLEYSVVGALTNQFYTSATIINLDSNNLGISTFEEIEYSTIQNLTLSSARNTIGYEWKDYIFESGGYVVFSNMIYIIKDIDGFYYKLRFRDFYNMDPDSAEFGSTGYPQIEFQRL